MIFDIEVGFSSSVGREIQRSAGRGAGFAEDADFCRHSAGRVRGRVAEGRVKMPE